jgi:NADPH-dependent 7-cyano-7-deazaguanine reductase QueF
MIMHLLDRRKFLVRQLRAFRSHHHFQEPHTSESGRNIMVKVAQIDLELWQSGYRGSLCACCVA